MIFLIYLPITLYDLYRYRIPNSLILAGYLVSLCHNICLSGMAGIGTFFLNLCIPLVVCLFFYCLRMLGAGDIKLYSLISSYYGFHFCGRVMLISLFLGAILSICKMIHEKNGIQRFQYFFQYVRKVMVVKKRIPYYDRKNQGEDAIIPFSLCISLAAILCRGGMINWIM